MLTDTCLLSLIQDEFRWDPRLADAEIAIGVKDGVASLAGTVANNAVKAAAAHAAERVSGVRAVANSVVVEPRGPHARTDTELAHAAVQALSYSPLVCDQDVRVRIDHGWAVLEGCVEKPYQREEAELAIANLVGIRGITNLLASHDQMDADAVADGIRDALARQAIEDSAGITVETIGDAIILRGTVASLAERDLAERAAWNSGVGEVQNEILVREMPDR